MWLYIVALLFFVLNWTAWYVLLPTGDEGFLYPTWVALTVSAVIVGGLVLLWLFRRIRARRAARALEKAIAQQAQEQISAAKPEDRAEVQELQKRMLDGIQALKGSALGSAAGNALYALPWYAIVGPPGAGKTTALRHSGLQFPYLDPDGAGVKGVGGTRNCDWWFTNEAVLLDTAGRYTTEQDDQVEWMAFLGFLKKYRRDKPLNGVLVAVAVDELIDASEEDIVQVGDRVRDRIDEMQEQLQMNLPVYVLFTKTDLVAGFTEFFGNLKRSERGQPWGSTFRLSQSKATPGDLFEQEFELLVEQLHKRTVERINNGRGSRAEKEKVYQFPLEFAAIKRNLAEFMSAAFAPNAETVSKSALAAPILRGFYFTSGTQEGRPLDRVVGAMGRAFGLRAAKDDAEDSPKVDSKSFFLKEVFTGIVFPDKDVAGRSASEMRRARWQKLALAAACASVAALFLGGTVNSFLNNRALIKKTSQLSQKVGTIDWSKGAALPNIEQLDALQAHLAQLDQWRDEGPPISYGWAMYQGNRLYKSVLEQYIFALRQGFILPVKARLESRLKLADGAKYLIDYNNLKAYLLLNRPVQLQQNESWERDQLTRVWADVLRSNAGAISEKDLRDKLSVHASYYVLLLRQLKVKGEELDKKLVNGSRTVLSRVGSIPRYYARFVTALESEKKNPVAPADRENMRFPWLTLSDLFRDRPNALSYLSSKQKRSEGKTYQVAGQFTYAGHVEVLSRLKDGYKLLEREKWVVPLTGDEKLQGSKIKTALKRVRQDYDQAYIRAWYDFFKDIEVKIPKNNVETIGEFKALSTPDWPYYRLIKALYDNTQFDRIDPSSVASAEANKKGGVIDQLKRRVGRKIDNKARTPGISKLLTAAGVRKKQAVDPVPVKFRRVVEFAIPPAPRAKEGEVPPPAPPSGLSGYVAQLAGLASEMTIIEEGPASGDPKKATELFEASVKDTETKIQSLDTLGRDLLTELLMNPLRQSYKAMLKSGGQAASGLWEVEVWPSYRDTVRNRYPFNLASRRDASFEDALAFFKPKDGILWGFYEGFLKGYHRRIRHKFVPSTHLSGLASGRKRFTPFNPNMYNCLERAHEISDALFAQGEPKVRFKVNLTTVSPIVSEIVFRVDGQERRYRNEKEFWHSLSWPGPDGPSGASIQILGAGGLDEEIHRDGPWGLFRLLEAGRHGAVKDKDKKFVVEWDFTAPPVKVRLEIRPTRSNHPFSRDFFRNTNCPQSIGDNFGG